MLLLIVDAANVIGSRPDGWWRDRAGAVTRLRDALAGALADGFDLGGVDSAWTGPVEVVLVTEGVARSVRAVPGVEVVAAAGSGDDAMVDLVDVRAGGPSAIVAVTADRELRRRLEDRGASVIGPRSLTARITY